MISSTQVLASAFFVAWFCLGPVCQAAPPKNVIMMIGDGMGPEQVKAAGMYLNGSAGTLNFESFPGQAMMTTASANASVTDSAAAGTSIATGVKVNNGVISVALPGDGSELPTMLELFKDMGKSTGLVTTTEITHATPATFGAHEPSRNNRSQIGDDYLNQTLPNVLFGGADFGLNVSKINNDGNYTLVQNRTELGVLDTDNEPFVAGLFGVGHMPYEYDYDQGTSTGYDTLPHLSEMTNVALDLLDNDPDGFFLMVEGGRIDHAGHTSGNQTIKTGRNVFETVEFASAVQEVLDWANLNDPGLTNTLIIVTADHETGGLMVTETNPTAGTLPAVVWGGTSHTGVDVPLAAIGVNSELISGVMDNTDLLAVVMKPTLPGDFDEDGDVDGMDFLAWQRGSSLLPLSSSDLDDWQTNYGAGASSMIAASIAVPEPATVFLAVLGGMALLAGNRRWC